MTSGLTQTNWLGSKWSAPYEILRTELRGTVTVDDVEVWKAGLYRELMEVPDGGKFRLLLDLRGFEPVDIAAHKAMRTVVPEVLANHAMRPAYIDLFDEKPEVEIHEDRGVHCVAFANVHHDEEKMSRYETLIGKPNQRFFTDLVSAEHWLRTAG